MSSVIAVMNMTKSLRYVTALKVAGRSANTDVELDGRADRRLEQSFALLVYILRDNFPTSRAASQ